METEKVELPPSTKYSLRVILDKYIKRAEEGSRAALYGLFVIGLMVVLVFYAIAIIFRPGVAGGTFGDFLGGTLNPLLTFLTFMAVLLTIVLQQTELAATRDELATSARALQAQHASLDRQNFETTFFQMLTLHNTIVTSIDLKWTSKDSRDYAVSPGRVEKEALGRDCFRNFYSDYKSIYDRTNPQDVPQKRFQDAFDEFWKGRQQDLSHYYRYLYNILRFVSDQKAISDRIRYVKLLRAQLSDYELLLLFYTSLHINGVNYWIYIHEYEIFDNLPIHMLISPSHKSLYSEKSFGEPKKQPPATWPPAELARQYEVAVAGAAKRPA